VITCQSCEIALPDGTRRCPMCQRYLALPFRTIIMVGAALVLLLLFGLLRFSGPIKNKVQAWSVTPRDVLAATQTLVAASPSGKNAAVFSGLSETTLEHWDGRRWRVSGYFENAGARTLYFAVVQHNGSTWDLEDLQLQSIQKGKKP
jgi:hypothetical protein